MKRVVITGGPCSGKTTIIEHLSKQGFQVVTECAIEVIEELNKDMGIEGQKKWRKENLVELQRILVAKQIEKESKIKAGKAEVVFFDRGMYNGLAYLRLMKKPVETELLAIIKGYTYDMVFALETLSNFQPRAETGRTSDREKSIAIGRLLEEVYKENGIEVVFVKEMSVEERVSFIKEHLGL